MFRHPNDDDLLRFARRELDEPTRARIPRHLARCSRCRTKVARLRELGQALAIGTEASEVPDVLERVLARRAAGERVLLPDVATTTPRPVRWGFAAAAAVVLMIASAALTLISAPRVNAAASTLRFIPENPPPGATIRVVYEAGPLLAGEDTLVLRGRFRTADDEPYNRGPQQRKVATLVRGSGGAFHGTFELAEAVVYAVFAVEDRAGSRLDHNRHALWELEVHGEDGRPLLAALEQRFNDFHGRSWEGMAESVRRMIQIHPDDPRGWSLLDFVQGRTLPPEGRDSLKAMLRQKGEVLHASLVDRENLPPYVLDAMSQLAPAAEERREWRDRLRREHPTSALSLFLRENEVNPLFESNKSHEDYFAVMEEVWQTIGGDLRRVRSMLLFNTISAAFQSDDPEMLLLWTERALSLPNLEPSTVLFIIRRLERWPALTSSAKSLLRQHLEQWQNGDDRLRPLTTTREVQARETAGWVNAGTAMLAKMLLAEGNVSAGLSLFDSATEDGWDSSVFLDAARGRASAGDTVGMLREFSRAAVDPAFESYADSARLVGGRHFDANLWAAWTKDARERMREVTLRDASVVPLRRSVRVKNAEGHVVRLAELVGDRVTVIAAWSPYCGFSLQELPEVERLYEWLQARGANLVPITERESPDVTRALTEAGVSFPNYYDKNNEAYDALVKFSEPAYWVVDASGRIVFSNVRLPDVRRQVAALMGEDGIGKPEVEAAHSRQP